MTSIMIVEDEVIVATNLVLILERQGYACFQTDRADEALQIASKNQIALFLLDISISGSVDGVQLGLKLRELYQAPIVFLTSYFDRQTLDRVKEIKPEAYIVKPFEERNLIANIELALYHQRRKPIRNQQSEKLFIKEQNELLAIDPYEIIYIEADDNYSNIHTSHKKYVLSHSMKKIEDKLAGNSFARIHKSYLINVSKVTSIQEGYVFLQDVQLPVGRTYRQSFMDILTVL